MVIDPVNNPSVLQWNNYRPAVPQTGKPESSTDLFPSIGAVDSLVNNNSQQAPPIAATNTTRAVTHGSHSPVHQLQHPPHHQSHDFNSPTSTSSSFSQPKNQTFDDYRYSHSATNWLYGPGANVHPSHHPNSEFQLDPQHNSTAFDDVGTSFHGEDSAKPRTDSSLTSISSPGYSSILDGESPKRRGRSSSTPQSDSAKIHKDSTGKTKRSRMGCLTCRHRKKRCCERRPKCEECERLGLKCTWPTPGLEHRNRPKNSKMNDDMHYDSFYGHIKILRGIVEYRINATS